MADELKCPKCGEPQCAELVAKLAAKSEVAFSLKPAPGEMMGAHTIGETINNIAKLLGAVGKGIGVPAEVLCKRVDTADDGTITATLIVCRFEEALRIRKRLKSAQAGESGTAETQGGSVHEHPVGEAEAPGPSLRPSVNTTDIG